MIPPPSLQSVINQKAIHRIVALGPLLLVLVNKAQLIVNSLNCNPLRISEHIVSIFNTMKEL